MFYFFPFLIKITVPIKASIDKTIIARKVSEKPKFSRRKPVTRELTERERKYTVSPIPIAVALYVSLNSEKNPLVTVRLLALPSKKIPEIIVRLKKPGKTGARSGKVNIRIKKRNNKVKGDFPSIFFPRKYKTTSVMIDAPPIMIPT